MVTSRFTKLFYCERPNIAHIISIPELSPETLENIVAKKEKF